MSTGTIFYFAIGVFTLMVIGIVLTGREFRKLNRESAARKGPDSRGQ
jgi:ABC-type long-subunit fatty acid transport system fused permease/ATPase subunit